MKEFTGSPDTVQYTVYKLKLPAYRDQRVLAIRGTKTPRTILHDICLFDPSQVLKEFIPSVFGPLKKTDGWKIIREIIDVVDTAAQLIKPDFIIGHSLGGLIAEVVSSRRQLPGFSFNSPGPVGLVSETSLLNADTAHYQGVKFEVHLRQNDLVSQINYELHINPHPVWHPGSSHHMDDMATDIQRDFSTMMEADAYQIVAGPMMGFNHRERRTNKKVKKVKFMKFLFRE